MKLLDLFRRPLLWIVLIGAGLRVTWWLSSPDVISLDGAEYLCAARNLARGDGFAGCYPGPELMYTPLYPVLTAAASFFTGDIGLAGHLVAIAFGTALILPVFHIAALIYGRRVAYLAASLVALQPILVQVAASTYNEAVYLTLFMGGIYFGLRLLLRRPTVMNSALTGAFFALAYLSRPEAFAYPVFFAVAVLVVAVLTREHLRPAASSAIVQIAMFALVASPYVGFLYASTDSVRLEGKTDINFTIGRRILSGMDYTQAAYGIGANADTSGPLLDPDHFADFTPFSNDNLLDKARQLWQDVAFNGTDARNLLRSNVTGGALTYALIVFGIVVGIYRSPQRLQRIIGEFVLVTMAASIVILIFTQHHVEARYAFPLIPILTIWAGNALFQLGWLVQRSSRWLPDRFSSRIPLPAVAQTLAAAALLVLPLRASRFLFEFTVEGASAVPMRDAATWLGSYQPGPKRVAVWDTRVAWYADATFVPMPAADSSSTLQYLDSEHPDFIYIDQFHPDESYDVLNTWLANGIPDEHAHLVYSATQNGESVQIYRWDSPSAAAASTE